jgi:hypothetical protein
MNYAVERRKDMHWRYGVKQYIEDADSSLFEIIEVHQGDDKEERWWASPFVMGDNMESIVRVTQMVTDDIKDLKQPDVITTLDEWWWADTPDEKHKVDKYEVD